MHGLFDMTKWRITAFVAALLAAWPLCAQTSGRVTDTDGASIVKAKVEPDCAREPVFTGQSGTFTLACSAKRVRVSANGFRPRVEFPRAGEPLNVVLEAMGPVEQITVSGSLYEVPLSESAQSITAVDEAQVRAAPQPAIDDVLRNVAGFSLFRRSGSRVANPTSQGVSLRGLGASGASRALVLWDGVPLNDPFGGWVYWTRVPPEAVERVEVLQGGGSDVYGDEALGGVVNVFRRQMRDRADIDLDGGNRRSFSGSVNAAKQLGKNVLSGFLSQGASGGYILVPSSQRGSVDTPANDRYLTGEARWGRDITGGNLFLAANGFGERRHNGSPLQSNDTALFQIVGGVEKEIGGGTLLARVDGSGQSYNQSFSAISADRNSETLSRLQHVPAQQLGGRAAWLRVLGSHSLSVGGDVRSIRGVTEETIFVGGAPSSLTHAGGRQLFGGGFVQDTWRVLPRLAITAGGRIDAWRNYDARALTAPLSGSSAPTQTVFADRTSTALDPRLSVVFHPRETISLFATGYRSFRAPRLNELYRAFRLGNVLTLANSNLEAERLTGVDAGIGGEWKRAAARATFFFARVEDPVANVTLTTTPALITRQRQNAGRLESRGLQLTSTWAISSALRIRGDYQFADSRIVAFGPNPLLVGKRTPQVPRHSFATSLLFDRGRWAASLQGRVSSNQFDDDVNQFALGGASSLDGYVARRWGSHFQTYLAAENILDSEDLIGRTPVPTVGLPFTFRGGIRISLGRDVQP